MQCPGYVIQHGLESMRAIHQPTPARITDAMSPSGKQIPLALPWLGAEESDAAAAAIRSGWVTQGPRVAELEARFASMAGSKHACAVANCTAALQCALLAVGVKPGDAVFTVSHSFIATANSIRACGAEPFFVDVEAASYNMDAGLLARALERCERRPDGLYAPEAGRLAAGSSPWAHLASLCGGSAKLGRVGAILAVHQIGIPCRIDEIAALGERFGVPVIEDAACALGSAWKPAGEAEFRPVGKAKGAIACFSFHPRKIVTTGDGGMLTTENPEYDRIFRLLRHHGMSLSDLDRHKSGGLAQESYEIAGFNYRMTDIQAAVGSAQLQKLELMCERRRALAGRYIDRLRGLSWLGCVEQSPRWRLNWQSFPILLTEDAPGSSEDLREHLLANGIASRPGIMNAHEERPYLAQSWSLPVSESLRRRAVILPLYHTLAEDDVDTIASAIRSFAALSKSR